MSNTDPTEPQPPTEPLVVAQPEMPESALEADYRERGMTAERVVYVEVFPL